MLIETSKSDVNIAKAKECSNEALNDDKIDINQKDNEISQLNSFNNLSQLNENNVFDENNVANENNPIQVKIKNDLVNIMSDTDEEDSVKSDIIDGIMFLNFKTEEELNEYTLKDEIELKKIKERNDLEIKTKLKKSANKSNSFTKSNKKIRQNDSAFISSELDDYLKKKTKKPVGFSDNLDENDVDISLNNDTDFNQNKSSKRKSKVDIHYNEDTDESEIETQTSSKPNSSIIKPNNILNLFNSMELSTKSTKSKSKQRLNKSKQKKPNFILTNIASSELLEDNNLNNVYLSCLKKSLNSFEVTKEKLKSLFNPVLLNEPQTRCALSILNCNKKALSNGELLDIGLKKEECLFKVKKDNENTQKSISPKLFKTQIKKEFEINSEKKIEDLEIDKMNLKRKVKNDIEIEDFDIAKIISKHSKRDIRLPARFNESSILIGSHWVLPNVEENKNRVVNTNSKKFVKNIKEEKIVLPNSNQETGINDSLDNLKVPIFNSKNTLDTQLKYEDLMSEDEDSNLNNSSTMSLKTIDKDLVIKDRDQKLLMLKELYRSLFYANKPHRIEFYTKRLIKPRVNKLEVIDEGVFTIDNLKKQKKHLNHAHSVLISWNNKLKLCLKSIEESKGDLSKDKRDNINKLLNSYRTNITNKVNQTLLAVQDLQTKSHINSEIVNNGNSNFQKTPSASFNDKKIVNTVETNQKNSKKIEGFVNPYNNPLAFNNLKQPRAFNCNSNVVFLDNTNGVSRVMNLKPKKPSQNINSANCSSYINTFNMKNNGMILNSNELKLEEFQNEKKKLKKKYVKSLNNSIEPTTNSSNYSSSPMQKSIFPNVNKNFMQCNNMNFLSASSNNNNFLTFKITGNGLQMPYYPEMVLDQQIPNQPNQLNHVISNQIPQLLPNNLSSNGSSFLNYCVKDTKFVPLNFIKPNESIPANHTNLSVPETISQTSNNNQQGLVRNYTKILPKYTSNVVKVATPVTLIPNLHLIPTTHNLVISPINTINSVQPNIATANCQLINSSSKLNANNLNKKNNEKTKGIIDKPPSNGNMPILPKLDIKNNSEAVGVNQK